MIQQSGSPNKIPAVDHWITQSERGFDRRTGYHVYSRERPREGADKSGKSSTVWDWVAVAPGTMADFEAAARGTSQNQLGARAAIRKFLRTLPDKDQSP